MSSNTTHAAYTVRFFGVLGDSWTSPVRFATRASAQAYARFMLTDRWVNRFDRTVRACFTRVHVEAV